MVEAVAVCVWREGERQIKNLSHLGAPSEATAREPVGGASRVSGWRVQAQRGTAAEDRIGVAEGVCGGCDGAPAAITTTKKADV